MGGQFGAYILKRLGVTQDTELLFPQAIFAKTKN